jgi:RNA polymerase sigma-70 factor (ECF subfamily)
MTASADPGGSLNSVLADLERFRAFIRSRMVDAHAVDDVLQEALLRATRGIASLRDDDRLDAWFYRIIRRAIADRARAPAMLAGNIDPATLAVEASERAAFCRCLEMVVDQLPVDQASAIRLVDVDGVDPAQAAQRLGISSNALHARRYRARLSLRTALEATCQACAREGCRDCSCDPPAAHSGGDDATQ